MDLKTRIYGILEPGDDDSKYFDPFIVGLIVLNIFAIILESVQSIREAYGSYLLLFEHFSVFVFTIEYILRLWSCNVVMPRLRYIKSPMAIVDLLQWMFVYRFFVYYMCIQVHHIAYTHV